MVADRFGSWKVMLAGLVLYALGLYGMAVITSAPAFMLVAGVCIGVAQSGTTFGVVYGALSRMVPPEDRSRTLGIAGAIGGIGQFLMVPSAQALLSFAGWTNALMVLAVCAAVLIPFALPFRDRAPASDAATGASHRCRCWPPSARLSATRASGCSTSASWHVASIGLYRQPSARLPARQGCSPLTAWPRWPSSHWPISSAPMCSAGWAGGIRGSTC
jgi:MFS family permease